MLTNRKLAGRDSSLVSEMSMNILLFGMIGAKNPIMKGVIEKLEYVSLCFALHGRVWKTSVRTEYQTEIISLLCF